MTNRNLLVVIPEIGHGGRAVSPVLLDLDPEVEVDFRAEHLLEILARVSADELESLAALADDDALVRSL